MLPPSAPLYSLLSAALPTHSSHSSPAAAVAAAASASASASADRFATICCWLQFPNRLCCCRGRWRSLFDDVCVLFLLLRILLQFVFVGVLYCCCFCCCCCSADCRHSHNNAICQLPLIPSPSDTHSNTHTDRHTAQFDDVTRQKDCDDDVSFAVCRLHTHTHTQCNCALPPAGLASCSPPPSFPLSFIFAVWLVAALFIFLLLSCSSLPLSLFVIFVFVLFFAVFASFPQNSWKKHVSSRRDATSTATPASTSATTRRQCLRLFSRFCCCR